MVARKDYRGRKDGRTFKEKGRKKGRKYGMMEVRKD